MKYEKQSAVGCLHFTVLSNRTVAFMQTNQMARKIWPELVHKNNNGGRIQQLCKEHILNKIPVYNAINNSFHLSSAAEDKW